MYINFSKEKKKNQKKFYENRKKINFKYRLGRGIKWNSAGINGKVYRIH